MTSGRLPTARSSATRPSPSGVRSTAAAPRPRAKWPIVLALGIAVTAGGGALLITRSARPAQKESTAPHTPDSGLDASVTPPAASPPVDVGLALMQALLAFDPVNRAIRLNDRIHQARQQDRLGVLAAESAQAASSTAASRLAAAKDSPGSLFPASLQWRERALRAQWLFDAMRYELTVIGTGGTGGLRVFDSLSPAMRFEAAPATYAGVPVTQATLDPAMHRAFPIPYKVSRLYVTTDDADTFGFENVKGGTVPTELDGIVTTNDVVQSVWEIPRIEVLPEAKGEVVFAAYTNDQDVQSAFLLRIRPTSTSADMLIPLLHLRTHLQGSWSLITTSLAPGVLPPGVYSGRLSCTKVTRGVGMRPNLRALYIAFKR